MNFFLGNINNSKAYATVNDSGIILVLEAAKDIEPVSHVQTVVSGVIPLNVTNVMILR